MKATICKHCGCMLAEKYGTMHMKSEWNTYVCDEGLSPTLEKILIAHAKASWKLYKWLNEHGANLLALSESEDEYVKRYIQFDSINIMLKHDSSNVEEGPFDPIYKVITVFDDYIPVNFNGVETLIESMKDSPTVFDNVTFDYQCYLYPKIEVDSVTGPSLWVKASITHKFCK